MRERDDRINEYKTKQTNESFLAMIAPSRLNDGTSLDAVLIEKMGQIIWNFPDAKLPHIQEAMRKAGVPFFLFVASKKLFKHKACISHKGQPKKQVSHHVYTVFDPKIHGLIPMTQEWIHCRNRCFMENFANLDPDCGEYRNCLSMLLDAGFDMPLEKDGKDDFRSVLENAIKAKFDNIEMHCPQKYEQLKTLLKNDPELAKRFEAAKCTISLTKTN
jgi:hypothetical protein